MNFHPTCPCPFIAPETRLPRSAPSARAASWNTPRFPCSRVSSFAPPPPGLAREEDQASSWYEKQRAPGGGEDSSLWRGPGALAKRWCARGENNAELGGKCTWQSVDRQEWRRRRDKQFRGAPRNGFRGQCKSQSVRSRGHERNLALGRRVRSLGASERSGTLLPTPLFSHTRPSPPRWSSSPTLSSLLSRPPCRRFATPPLSLLPLSAPNQRGYFLSPFITGPPFPGSTGRFKSAN